MNSTRLVRGTLWLLAILVLTVMAVPSPDGRAAESDTAGMSSEVVVPQTGPVSAPARRRPEFDALASIAPDKALSAQVAASAGNLLRYGAPFHADERFGVPTFLWASQDGSEAGLARARALAGGVSQQGGALRPEDAARGHLDVYSELYGLSPDDVIKATVVDVHDLGRGPIIVQLRQSIDGIEVFRERVSIVMDRSLNLVGISGSITGAAKAKGASAPTSPIGSLEAVALAYSDLSGKEIQAGDVSSLGARDGGFEELDVLPGFKGELGAATQPARAKPVWFHDLGGLEAAWYVEVDSANAIGSDLYAYVIAAADGRILFRHDLTEYDAAALNQFTYRVWAAQPNDPSNPTLPFDGPQGNAFGPHPTGTLDGTQPPGTVATNDVSLVSSPYASDAWLPIGSTETVGNNTDAYSDISGADGYTPATGDFRANVTAPGEFLHTYDAATPGALESRKAALVQMFYNVNFWHDWYYASGFTESAGNAQSSNYGRGGLEGDSFRSEGHDQAGRNNANMSTPADGGRPRMQMFLFDGIAERHLYATANASTTDYPAGVPSGWGINPASAYDLTADAVWVTDGVGSAAYPPATTTTSTIHDGCNYTPGSGGTVDPAWAPVTGKIAFIDRGGPAAPSCGFSDKGFNATRAGAIAVIIASTTTHGAPSPITMGATAGSGITTIPALQLSTPHGDAIRSFLIAGTPVSIHITRAASIDRDGTLDTQIMAHEWGHYISNRLVANSSGLTTNMARGMGEGWADFHAMLLTVKEEDAAVAGNDQYQGVYGTAVWVTTGGTNGPVPNQGVYFGIRRMPYSTDMTKNSMTYRNIQDNSPVPVGVPFSFWPAPGTTAVNNGNSEVHNTGEVWASMLWECYVALLRDTTGASPRLTFAEARERMKDYLVAGYKLTPPQPTFIESRDAVLAAAYAGGDTRDYNLFLAAFARRGIGFGAISPDRYSATNNGVTESFAVAPNLVFTSASIVDNAVTCDNDGNLDTGETGTLTVRLRNDTEQVLTATSATVTAIGPNAANVSFPAGGGIALSSTNPLETAIGTIPIALATGLTGEQQVDLRIDFMDSALVSLGTQSVNFSRRGNIDEVVGQSFTDNVEPNLATGFTQVILAPPAGGQNIPVGWFRGEISAYDHNYKAADLNGVSDIALVSPVLNIGTGPLSVSFRHRYSFEFSGATLFDGGVVEVSSDAGSNWVDITTLPGVIVTGQGYATAALAGGSPLGRRRAFAAISPGYPAFVTTTYNLGTQFAGLLATTTTGFVVRFRIGTDSNGRADGWEIDDITVAGSATRPFRSLLSNKCNAAVSPGQPNRRPTAAIGTQAAVQERTLVTLTGATSADLDGDTLQYFWAQLSGTSAAITQDANSPTMSFTAPDVPTAGGSVVMTLTVSDGTAFSTTVTRTVAITSVDRPPVASAGPDQTLDERTLGTLDGSGSSDPDGDPLTYAWIQTAGPAAPLFGANTVSPLFGVPEVGPAGATLTFQVTVTALGVPRTDTVNVSVQNVNQAPQASAGPDQAVGERTLATLNGSGSVDPDGDPLTYAWIQTGGPAVSLSGANSASPFFIVPEVGPAGATLTFQLTVTATGGNSSDTVNVTAQNVNRAPTASAGASQSLNEGTLAQLPGSANDVDGDPLTYIWTQLSPASPVVTLSNPGTLQPTFTAPEVASDTPFVFQLEVSDGIAPPVTSTTTVTVLDAPPVCVAPDEEIYITMVTLDMNGNPVLHYQDANQPSDVTGYNIYRSSNPIGPWTMIASDVVDMDEATPDKQYVDSTADVGEIFYYKIAAYNNVCSLEGPF